MTSGRCRIRWGRWPRSGLPGLHIAHPDAVHPLLARLGAGTADRRPCSSTRRWPRPSTARWTTPRPGWTRVRWPRPCWRWSGSGPALRRAGSTAFGALALPDADGDPTRADELMLPDAALRPLLAADAPIGVLDPAWAARFPRARWTAIGVLDGFAVVVDEEPVGPDHDLDDEERWWDGHPEPPRPGCSRCATSTWSTTAPGRPRWPCSPPTGRPGPRPSPPAATPAWWLARHARLGGHRPGHYRVSSADAAGRALRPGSRDRRATRPFLAAIGVRADLAVPDARAAADLLARLADPRRRPDTALVAAAHAALAEAVVAGRVHPDDLDPPERVRALDGAVVDVDVAVVLDAPWLAAVLPAGELVGGGDPVALAELLDLPLATEVVEATVPAGGTRAVGWAELAEVVLACRQLGIAGAGRGAAAGTTSCGCRRARPVPGRFRVPAWRDEHGRWHAEDPLRALLGVLADPR